MRSVPFQLRLSLRLLLLFAASCGYQSARPPFDRIEVAAVAAEAPAPEVAACLTRELRLGLAARGVHVEPGSTLRLEGELRTAEARPGAVVVDRGPVAVEQHLSLVVRLRVVDRRRGLVWGPTHIRVEGIAALGPSGVHSSAAADEGLLRRCREAADEALTELILSDQERLRGRTPQRSR